MTGVNKKTRRMMLCPKCRTIQKAGEVCSNCRCPVIASDAGPILEKCPNCNKQKPVNTKCPWCGYLVN